jgi:hypothetical protein
MKRHTIERAASAALEAGIRHTREAHPVRQDWTARDSGAGYPPLARAVNAT